MVCHAHFAVFTIFCGFLFSVTAWGNDVNAATQPQDIVAEAERQLADYDKQIFAEMKSGLPPTRKLAELRKARTDYYIHIEPRIIELLAARELELATVVREMGPKAAPMRAKEAEVNRLRALGFVNCIGARFVRIAPGTFMMGSPAGEVGRFEDETLHRVTFTQPLRVATTHVTLGQFASFVAETGYKTDAEKQGKAWAMIVTKTRAGFDEVADVSWRNPGYKQTDEHPVVAVSWNDAVAFCKWLSAEEHRTYRLPTEAEWEYACRGGRQTAYFWGDNPDDGRAYANCADLTFGEFNLACRDVFNWRDGFIFTSRVGSFKPNEFGLYDMIGNALEWCGDRYSPYPLADAVDPKGATAGPDAAARVVRGGSWFNVPRNCRCADRIWFAPDYACDHCGFRLCVDF
jgi:formylglycine-generating enzyme required for sulfatase activity